MNEYEISIDGCDASTEFSMRLTQEEYLIIRKLAEKSKEVSTYGCEPVLEIELVEK